MSTEDPGFAAGTAARPLAAPNPRNPSGTPLRPNDPTVTGHDDEGPPVVVIQARGGSKGLPLKNLLPVAGVPLVAWRPGGP